MRDLTASERSVLRYVGKKQPIYATDVISGTQIASAPAILANLKRDGFIDVEPEDPMWRRGRGKPRLLYSLSSEGKATLSDLLAGEMPVPDWLHRAQRVVSRALTHETLVQTLDETLRRDPVLVRELLDLAESATEALSRYFEAEKEPESTQFQTPSPSVVPDLERIQSDFSLKARAAKFKIRNPGYISDPSILRERRELLELSGDACYLWMLESKRADLPAGDLQIFARLYSLIAEILHFWRSVIKEGEAEKFDELLSRAYVTLINAEVSIGVHPDEPLRSLREALRYNAESKGLPFRLPEGANVDLIETALQEFELSQADDSKFAETLTRAEKRLEATFRRFGKDNGPDRQRKINELRRFRDVGGDPSPYLERMGLPENVL